MYTGMMVVRWLWPFLKEMILNGKTLKESFKTAKLRVAFLLIIVSVIAMSITVAMEKIITHEEPPKSSPEPTPNFKELESRISGLESGFRFDNGQPPLLDPKITPESIEQVGVTPTIDPPKPVVPKAKPKRTPPPPANKVEDKVDDRKKDYMDFFDKHSG